MQIYKILKTEKNISVSHLAKKINLTQPTVSYHLREMEKDGLLVREKKGKEVFYRLSGRCPNYNVDCVINSVDIPENTK
jgi:DNA-binding transcriptional ArsR family regulator